MQRNQLRILEWQVSHRGGVSLTRTSHEQAPTADWTLNFNRIESYTNSTGLSSRVPVTVSAMRRRRRVR
jgi:hypothetical protein